VGTPKRPRDVNELAAEIAREATEEDRPTKVEPAPEPDSVTFGREGGKKRASRMTSEERSAAARKAVRARWDKQKS
jgi:hypothetical protein